MAEAKGEIVIDEQLCTGCGICIAFCKRECITSSVEKLTMLGAPKAVFAVPEKCTACCICGWLCPHCCIEVYRHVDEGAAEEVKTTP